jgi:glycerol kinase
MPPDRPGPLTLALDQGGHASRALVFDAHGQVLARSLRAVNTYSPQPGWVEQDPEALVGSLVEALHAVLQELGPRAADVRAAGLATQRSSIVCWDRITGAALSPVISWQDRRAHSWLQRFAPQRERIHATTGLMLSAHYGASKLRWCLDHLPRVAQAASAGRLACGPLASFLVFRLTAERTLAVDPANAARTLLVSQRTLDWDDGLLHLFAVPRAALPQCVPTRFGYGRLAAAPQIALEIVSGDQSAALFASGAPQPSSAYLNMGTGAFVQRVAGHRPGHHPQLLSGVVLHDGADRLYVLEGTVNGAGAALAWIAGELGIGNLDDQLHGWLARAMPERPAGAGALLFLNGIGGLGAPYWRADFESRFTATGAPWQQVCAVAESIVFLIQANLELLQDPASPLEQIVASGGLAEHDGLCQRLSDLSGLPLYRPLEHEATGRGLAWLLAGKPRAWPERAPGAWFRPRSNPGLHQRYRDWRAAMDAALA